MEQNKGKFFRVLVIELEELTQDLREAVKLYEARNVSGDVTNYVLRENTALLENEIGGVAHVLEVVRQAGPEEDESFEELVSRVRSLCRRAIEESHYPDALFGMVDRKLTKVESYIRE